MNAPLSELEMGTEKTRGLSRLKLLHADSTAELETKQELEEPVEDVEPVDTPVFAGGRRTLAMADPRDANTAPSTRRVVCSADGKILAACNWAGLVRVWDTTTFKELHSFRPHGDSRVDGLALSPDGKWLASAGRDGCHALMDLSDGTEEWRMKHGNEDCIRALAFGFHNGTLLLAVGVEKHLRLFNVFRKKEVARAEAEMAWDCCFSPDGTSLISMEKESLLRFTLPEEWKGEVMDLHREVLFTANDYIYSVAVSPDGETIAAGGKCTGVLLVESKTGLLSRAPPPVGRSRVIWDVTYHSSGKTIAVCLSSGSCLLLDLETDYCFQRFRHNTRPLQPAFDAVFCGTSCIAVAFSVSGEVALFGIAKGFVGCKRRHTARVTSLAFVPQDNTLVSADWEGHVYVGSLYAQELNCPSIALPLRKSAKPVLPVRSVAVSDNGVLLATAHDDGVVAVFNMADVKGSGVSLEEKEVEKTAACSFKESGRTYNVQKFRRCLTCTQYMEVGTFGCCLNCAEVCHKGHELSEVVRARFFCDCGAGVMPQRCLCQRKTPKERQTELPPIEAKPLKELWSASVELSNNGKCDRLLSQIVFTVDNTTLCVPSKNSICLFDAETGRKGAVLKAHSDHIVDLAASPTGSLLASASRDQTIGLWDLSTNEHKRLRGHVGAVLCVSFSPNGEYLASGGLDGILRIWNVESGNCEQQLNARPFLYRLCWNYRGDRLFAVQFTSRYVSPTALRTIWEWNTKTWEVVGITPTRREVRDIRATNNGTVVVGMGATVEMRGLSALPSWTDLIRVTSNFAKDSLDDANTPFDCLLKKFPSLPALRFPARKGGTIVHELAQRGLYEPLQRLLQHPKAGRASHHLMEDDEGKSPLDCALDSGHDSCVRILLEALPNMKPTARAPFTRVIPALAEDYSEYLVSALQSLPLDVLPARCGVQKECKRVEYMSSGDVFYAPSEKLHPQGLWKTQLEDRASLHTGIEVSSRVVGLPGLAGLFRRKDHPLYAILRHKLVDAMGSPVMRHVLDFKWKAFAARRFLCRMAFYMFFLMVFVLATLLSRCPRYLSESRPSALSKHDGQVPGWVQLLLDGFTLCCAVYLLYCELKQLLREGWSYLYNPWNYFDVGGLTLILVAVPHRLECSEHQDTLLAVAAVPLWLKILDFARGLPQSGPFVRMIFEIVRGITAFLAVLAIVILGFSHSFFLLFRNTDITDFNSWSALLSVWRLMLTGDTEHVDDFGLASSRGVMICLFVLYTFLNMVVMLNLLIALMGDVYNRVQASVESEWLMERAEIILEIELALSESSRKWKHFFPQWVHVLMPAVGIGKKEDTRTVAAVEKNMEERLQEMQKKMEGMVSEQKELTEKIMQLTTELLAEVKGKQEEEKKEE